MNYLVPVGAWWLTCGVVNALVISNLITNFNKSWFKVRMANAKTDEHRNKIMEKIQAQSSLTTGITFLGFTLGPVATFIFTLMGIVMLRGSGRGEYDCDWEKNEKKD